MKIGYKYALHSNPFPNDNDEPDYLVIVEVVELKAVRDAWNQEVHADAGWRAVDKDGNEFFNCWDRFPSDSMTPHWRWTEGKTRNGGFDRTVFNDWYDITQLMRRPVIIPECLKLDFLHYCEDHMGFSYVREDGVLCHMCKHGIKGYKTNKRVYAPNEIPWGTWSE